MTRVVLGVDGHRLVGARTGVGRYVAELLGAWAAEPLPFDEVRVFVPPGTAVPPPLTARVLPERAGLGAWFHWTCGRAASRETDLLFCPSYAAPLSYRGPFVVTVHDALTAFMPPGSGLRQRWRHEAIARSARRALHVITVSETSKRDIARLYAVDPDRITVVPNGCGEEFFARRGRNGARCGQRAARARGRAVLPVRGQARTPPQPAGARAGVRRRACPRRL